LAAILLPALSAAKSKAQSIACLNNLKQLQIAWITYAHDHQDRMVPATTTGYHGDWWHSVAPSWVFGCAAMDTNTADLTDSLLFAYTSSLGIYRCPADRSPLLDYSGIPISSSQPRLRSYGLNIMLNGHWLPDSPAFDGYVVQEKTTSWQSPPPAEVFTFVEIHEDIIDDGTYGQDSPQTWWHYPATRHKSGSDTAFVDGHAAFHRLKFTGARWGGKFPAPGSDQEDLNWFTSRMVLH